MTMTMQPELPWNVAGIAPEAREAARASARREGLSVGEWLTRRILRGLSEAAADEWWLTETTQPPHMLREHVRAPAQIPSNENKFRNGDSRTADRLQTFARRPDETARGPIESKRALGEAVAEIRLATHEPTESAEQLRKRMAQLDSRIGGIERDAAAGRAKEAETIKALQARITGLANQVAEIKSHSRTQGTELAKALEAVAEKFSQFRGEADEQSHVMDGRVSAIAENIGAISEQLAESREEAERQLHTVEQRVAAIEGVVETIGHESNATARLDGSLETLTRRFEAAEAEYLNNAERFETRLTRIEADSGEATIDRRLQGIEQTLADMAKLIEKNTKERTTPAEAIGQAEPLSAAMSSAESRNAASAPSGANSAMPILDLPPFPEKPKSSFAGTPNEVATGLPLRDMRASVQSTSTPDDSAKLATAAEVESFLAAERRNAQPTNAQAQRTASFSWVDPAGHEQVHEKMNTRIVLLGGLGLLVFAAMGTGLYLSNNVPPAAAPAHAMGNAITRSAQTAVRPRAQTHKPQQALPETAAAAQPHAKPAVLAAQPKPGTTAGTSPTHSAPAAARLRSPAAPVHLAQAATAPTRPLTPFQRLAELANAGNAKAQEVLGLAYLDGDGIAVNEAEGAKWLERAAARGEAVAAYRLGTLYERGHGVTVDHAKATQWYAAAAKTGNRKAMHNLAVAYAQGVGVQKNMSLAAQWFLRAANLGLADSQFDLAVLYERGLGVQQSLAQAYKWYAIAAAEGDAESRTRMEAIASQIGAGDKGTAEKAAVAFQPAALDRAANAPPIAASLVGG